MNLIECSMHAATVLVLKATTNFCSLAQLHIKRATRLLNSLIHVLTQADHHFFQMTLISCTPVKVTS